jgi:methionyl aminopeptidase
MTKNEHKRNDPCWCGSGKKYKKCHLNQDSRVHAPLQKKKQSSRMIKTHDEIDGMRKAGAFNGQLLDYLRPHIIAGISTEKINTLAHTYTVDNGHIPACLHYNGFPKSLCTSINNVVCHGIPSIHEILKHGDIVNIDCTTIVNGFYGDSSETFIIGTVPPKVRDLIEVTAEALLRGIDAARAGEPLAAIAMAIEPFVNSKGFSVVRQYTGHGIGKAFHEYFNVFHHIASDNEHIILVPGMTLTVEPMINLGKYPVVTDPNDHWTVRTKDGSLSAQFEHTILITEHEPEILTLTPSQKLAGRTLLPF